VARKCRKKPSRCEPFIFWRDAAPLLPPPILDGAVLPLKADTKQGKQTQIFAVITFTLTLQPSLL